MSRSTVGSRITVGSRSTVGSRATVGSALAIAVAIVVAGCNGHQALVMRTQVIPLGRPGGGCVGTEDDLRAERSAKITRTWDEASEVCTHEVIWSGTLLDTSQLERRLKAGVQPTVKKVVIRFLPLKITDELGSAVSVTLPKLSLSLSVGGEELLTIDGKAIKNPLGPAKTVVFSNALRVLLAEHLGRHAPLVAKAKVHIELDKETRAALAKAAKGPLLELRFSATIEIEPQKSGDAGKAKTPPASEPAATQPATSR